MIRVMIADDHPVVRAGYQRLLDQAGGIRVVAEAGDAEKAYQIWADYIPDVLVTDLSMPGGGLELLRRVLQRQPQARVLIFSMHDSALLVRRAFDTGAMGYLTKASAPDCLVDAVRSLREGRRYLSPELPSQWLQQLDAASQQPLHSLSPREFEVFRLLAQGRSPAECAQELKLSAKTVSNLQTIIKDKLGVGTTAALAHLAITHGVIAASG